MIIEELVEEDEKAVASESCKGSSSSSAECSSSTPLEASGGSRREDVSHSVKSSAESDSLRNLQTNPEAVKYGPCMSLFVVSTACRLSFQIYKLACL